MKQSLFFTTDKELKLARPLVPELPCQPCLKFASKAGAYPHGGTAFRSFLSMEGSKLHLKILDLVGNAYQGPSGLIWAL
jgi:hypothetical protein